MLLNNFLHNIGIWKNKKICVGLSGGLDSVVLLHLLSRVSAQRLSAVYVHHGLNDEADNWQQFCQAYCKRLGVDFCAVRVYVNPEKQGIEAAARQERYKVFEQQNCDVIALAHHADDQVETFLLAALRGGGLRALSAMPFERILFQNKWLIRPMLIFSREQIEQYAQQHHLDYVQDDSNFDTTLRRNFIRQVWLPKIREYLPNYQKQILTSVAILQDELALLNEVIQQDWFAIHQITGQFSCKIWRTLPEKRQQHLLHEFVLRHHLGMPRRASIIDFAQILRQGQGEWSLPKGKAIAWRDVLFAVPDDIQIDDCIVENFSGSVRVANKFDRIKIRNGHKNVFQLLSEMGVPPFARKFWLVAVNENNECMAIANGRSVLNNVHLTSQKLAQFQIRI